MRELEMHEQNGDKCKISKNIDASDMNILFISHTYSTFTKSQIDRVASKFNNVVVLVRYNPIAKLGEYLPIQRLQRFTKNTKVVKNKMPSNVTVNITPLWYLPTNTGYQKLGSKHFQEVKLQVSEMDMEFDLIHAHFTWTAGYAAAKLSEQLSIPYVLTCHANRDRFIEEYESDNEKIKEAWRLADGIIRVNERDAKMLHEYNKNVYTIPNGYSANKFQFMAQNQAREEIGISEDTNLIFSLGNLVKRKGFHELINSMPILSKNVDNLMCAIGGHGKERRALKSRIQRKNVDQIVSLLGYVSNEKINYWMNAADVFVLPSFSESFGVVQLEAMACGTPVVATRNGGSEEVITDEQYGILIDDPKNSDALANALEEAIFCSWDRNYIKDNAEKFTWENVSKEIISVYSDAV